MEEFPGNSRRNTEPTPSPVQPAEELKLDKVVTGKVVRRKTPLGRRLMATFFSGDSNSVVGYLGKEVLLPALQNLITDFVTQGIEKAVYGEVRSTGRTARGSATPRAHISYDRPSSIIRAPAARAPEPRRAVTQRSAVDIEEIILDSKIAAEMVTEKLNEIIEEYGAATVGHLNDLIGQTSAYTDHKWGWTDLSEMRIRRVREGYLLLLPEPEDMR